MSETSDVEATADKASIDQARSDLPDVADDDRSKSFGVAALIVSIIEAVLFFGSVVLIGVSFGHLIAALTQLAKSTEAAGHTAGTAGTLAIVMALAFVLGVILIGSALTLAIQAIATGKGRKLGVVSLIIAISPFIVPGIAAAVISH